MQQVTPTGSGTIPPTATPFGTLPPACPPEVKAPAAGKIIVFLGPVVIYSGCEPQVNASGLGTSAGVIPTRLYHDPASGLPSALGYVGDPYAVFDYSPDELMRLITIVETFKCEELGMPLAACHAVNGIQITAEGYILMTASEMRAKSGTVGGTLNPQGQSTSIYLPLLSK